MTDQQVEVESGEEDLALGAVVKDLYERINVVLGLLSALGEMQGAKLKSRQLPDGSVTFYWDRGGRIVRPGGGTFQ